MARRASSSSSGTARVGKASAGKILISNTRKKEALAVHTQLTFSKLHKHWSACALVRASKARSKAAVHSFVVFRAPVDPIVIVRPRLATSAVVRVTINRHVVLGDRNCCAQWRSNKGCEGQEGQKARPDKVFRGLLGVSRTGSTVTGWTAHSSQLTAHSQRHAKHLVYLFQCAISVY